MPELGAIRTAAEAPAGREQFRKKAIIGYTEHKARAPFLNKYWELWGLNDLYIDLPTIPDTVERVRWFQLHQWRGPAQHDQPPNPMDFSQGPINPRDPNHLAWMQEACKHIPVYVAGDHPEMPGALRFPSKAVLEFFGVPYFTNSISWMIGLAIMELVEPHEINGKTVWLAVEGAELGVFGVDMMVAGGLGSEYGWQRPSCEWLLGWAMGAGITVTVPDESDLLKTAFQYGEMEFSPFRKKLMSHTSEMQRRLNTVNQQMGQLQRAQAELQGAINVGNWMQGAWMPGDSGADGAPAPMPNAHKKHALTVGGAPVVAVEESEQVPEQG